MRAGSKENQQAAGIGNTWDENGDLRGRQICRAGRTGILGFEAGKGNDDGQRLKLQMLGL